MYTMRLTNELLKETITDTAGADVIQLVEKIKNKKNFSEFKLAEALGQEINYTRNQLYRLLKFNLVSFIKKKDKRKGWYIYYWTFKLRQVKYLMVKLKEERLEKLKERLRREQETQFYSCKSKCMRVQFDAAIDLQFMCPECGEVQELENNEEQIKNIQKEINEVEHILKTIDKD